MRSRLTITAAVALAMVAMSMTGVAATSAMGDDSTPLAHEDAAGDQPVFDETNSLMLERSTLQKSSGPVVVTVDPTDGTIVSVDENPVVAFSDIGTTPNNCTNSRPCWLAHPPAATLEIGFVGTGAIGGTWTLRTRWESRNRESLICWKGTLQNICSWRLAKYEIVEFTEPATGVQATLY